jgi:hypothetical protein
MVVEAPACRSQQGERQTARRKHSSHRAGKWMHAMVTRSRRQPTGAVRRNNRNINGLEPIGQLVLLTRIALGTAFA